MTKTIATAYVRFIQISGGKRRPVYILRETHTELFFFNITTKYTSKSDFIKQWYFEIKDYHPTRLKKQSWIDTYQLYSLAKKTTEINYTGQLSDDDTARLRHFLERIKNLNRE
ncbi:type II toxin-antitoxin system PemK/MazF family toxin [Lactiplantibacillus plajomi]|uniref:Type II toxin-antitoxin system PemK/MazF family toxin n=1 Tax=Lactiplantibacillus plajomi TaxID=1457217 RepID=A0ABV6K3P3_9LACO|nr:type II toxin-antitoxin system PemK/MazF family toxin [Lactiplantibacillus plajomi]